MPIGSLSAALRQEASRLGFDLVGMCPVVTPLGITHFERWLAAGYAGEMRYLSERAEAYRDPGRVLEGARSIVMLGKSYRTDDGAGVGAGQGRISRYAWGDDYHDLIHQRLRKLAEFHQRLAPHARVRGVVDTAPLLEREFAQLAGLGWIGKNTLILNPGLGSWFFLAALLTTEPLEPDAPWTADHCGTCRACLDACPTGALVDAYELDARRCISYLTIEHRGTVPETSRGSMGEWLFGCDVCQEVCPWNRRAPASREAAFRPAAGMNPADLCSLFLLDEEGFRGRFRATPLWRPKRRGVLRNAAIVLGNRPHPTALGALCRGLEDEEPLVRGACAWALGRYEAAGARAALENRRVVESDPEVVVEIEASLERLNGTE